MPNATIMGAVVERTRNRYGLNIHDKTKSVLMWALYLVSFMWLWNRTFMTNYWTTIAGRCYRPAGTDPTSWRTITHEGKHADQSNLVGEPWFSLAYLFPQSLALVTIPGAIVATILLGLPWELGVILAVTPLGPWPAPWRVRYEREAYTMTAIADTFVGVDITTPEYLAWMARHFAGFAYYKPVWRASRARAIADDIVLHARAAIAGDAGADPYLIDLLGVIRRA